MGVPLGVWGAGLSCCESLQWRWAAGWGLQGKPAFLPVWVAPKNSCMRTQQQQQQ